MEVTLTVGNILIPLKGCASQERAPAGFDCVHVILSSVSFHGHVIFIFIFIWNPNLYPARVQLGTEADT
jgi:hypothetical protein